MALAGPSPQRTVRVRLAATVNPDGASSQPSLSGDARRVAFASQATNLVAADANGKVSDIFVYDQGTSVVELVSAGPNGEAAAGRSEHPVLDGDGSHVVFVSDADNLVAGDRNEAADVFVRAPDAASPASASPARATRRTARRLSPTSPRTGAMSCSPQMPAISSRVTQTATPTCSSATCSPVSPHW